MLYTLESILSAHARVTASRAIRLSGFGSVVQVRTADSVGWTTLGLVGHCRASVAGSGSQTYFAVLHWVARMLREKGL